MIKDEEILRINNMNKKRRISSIKRWSTINHKIEYALLRTAISIARLIPDTILRKAAMWLFSVIQFRRDLAKNNLKMVFPEMSKAKREQILKEMYRNLGLTAVESFLMKPEKVFENLEFWGWEEVNRLREAGKGVIVVTGHLGNFEMSGRLMAHQAPLCVIVKRQSNPYFDKYVNKQRLKENCEPVKSGNALRPVLKKLKQNGLVVMMIDQNARYQGYQLDFLGHKASTHISTAKIALLSKAPVVIVGITRTSKGYPLLKYSETIDTTDYENTLEGQIALMQEINDAFGKLVKANPEHWFWVHLRWRKPELGKPLTEID